MAAEPWTRGAVVKVRIGIHTGEAELAAGVYVGIDVHRAARIMAAAHGGQIVAVGGDLRAGQPVELPAGASLRDLGEHRLKDLPGAGAALPGQRGRASTPSSRRSRTLDSDAEQPAAPADRLVGREAELEQHRRACCAATRSGS